MVDRLRRVYQWFDDRLDLDREVPFLGKAFPAEDSYLLGEIALFNFFVLALTGVFLGFFFEPSTAEIEYQGSVIQYQGQQLPEAFVSVLYITYDVPYGMFLRRMHHWAAHLFVASLSLHMLRVFFSGAYQNPREPNWVIGAALAVLSMFASYTGYVLPFDEFATTATQIGYSIARSVPLMGDLLAKLVFAGDFPSSATIPRLYFIHVFILPASIAVLIALHVAILIRQKHTEAPRGSGIDAGDESVERDDDSVVVGLPAFPNQAAISVALFFLTLATLSLLSGFLPVHNVAEYGPYDPTSTPELVMPDWFLMWIFGFLKLIPAWASFTIPVVDVRVSTEFIGGMVLPGLVFLVLFAWPFIDARDEPRHFAVDPLARPVQTAVGIAGIGLVIIASLAGMNTIVADVTGLPIQAVNSGLFVAMIFGPLVAGGLTYLVLDRYQESHSDGRTPGSPDGPNRAFGHRDDEHSLDKRDGEEKDE